MNLIDGKSYIDGRGAKITIGGSCINHPDWCWSIQGDWYERATGKSIRYRNFVVWPKEDFRHVVESTSMDLLKEAAT